MSDIPMRRTFQDVRPELDFARPGDFAWIMATVNDVPVRHFAVVVPGPLFSMVPVRRDTDPDDPRAWTWNGDEDKPTMMPSLLIRDAQSSFHCWVRDGILKVLP